MQHTSSRLVCFCLLAVSDEEAAPDSLVGVCVVSRTGRGIAEVVGVLVAKGMFPRPEFRLGVPLMVPGLADMVAVGSEWLPLSVPVG